MSKIYLIAGTGISPGNYRYWRDQNECNNFFRSKAYKIVEDLSRVRADPDTKNAYNAASVHLPMPYFNCDRCDYITVDNIDGRLYHARVIAVEYVNENSTRLYFETDFIATFWGDIVLEPSFVERSHVSDDWRGGFTASKYTLPEPIPTEIIGAGGAIGTNPLQIINALLKPTSGYDFNLITTVKPDGTINEPEIKFQAGGSVSGYLSYGDKETIEQVMSNYVTYSTQLINKKDTILSYVNNLYITPSVVTANDSPLPIFTTNALTFSSLFNLGGLYKPRNAKVYDYLRVKFYTLTNEVIFSPKDFASSVIEVVVDQIGGPSGTFIATFYSDDFSAYIAKLELPTWPSVDSSATIKSDEYSVRTPSININRSVNSLGGQ